jgi:hypothetical protein
MNPVDPPLDGVQRVGPPDAPRSTPPGTALVPSGGNAHDYAENYAVDGAFAVLVVAAALVRHATEALARSRRSILPRLPLPGPVLHRVFHGPVARVLARPASAAVRVLAAAADELVPEATRAVLARLDVPALVREFVDLDRLAAMLDADAVVARVDLDAVLDRVDLNAIAARLDLDAVAARLDLDTLVDKVDISRILYRVDLDAVVDRVNLDRAVARVDIDAVLDRVDLDAIAARLDLDTLVDKVDIARILDRVDLDAVVDRVNLDRAVGRVDLDVVVDRVDLDRAVDRVDVDRVIARTDVAGIARYVVQEIDLPGLLRASTGSVTSEVVRSVRDQGADADRAVERVVDRLLHRHGRHTGTGHGSPETGQGADRDDG